MINLGSSEIQMKLLIERLSQLDTEIDRTKEHQHTLSTRGAVWFDDLSKFQTGDLVKTLELLYEKKLALEERIKLYQAEIENSQTNNDLKQGFESTYTVHNVNILWNETVRNAIFRIVELQSKGDVFLIKRFTN